MKAKIFTYVTAMILFGALMAPFPPTAQEQVNNRAPAPRRYTVEVLQGLGGLAGAFSINDTGLVSGTSEPPGDPFDRALVWRDAQPTDLGTLGGHNSSVAYPNKNDNGWLAGFSETADSDPYQENFCQFICSSPTSPLRGQSARPDRWLPVVPRCVRSMPTALGKP